LLRRAFREANGECAWRRADIDDVVAALLGAGVAILGGEVWWLKPDGRTWYAAVPDETGRVGHWIWETRRTSGETWPAFIQRCAEETRKSAAMWPRPARVLPNLAGEPVYNLTWITEAEFSTGPFGPTLTE
jgi:hypothetical protein